MITSWPVVSLGSLIKQRKDSIQLLDDERYRRVTVRLHARGIEARDEILGRDIKTKKQFPLRPNDLLIAEIDAKVGGYGIVPPSLAGGVVSSHYFIYEVDQSVLNVPFLNYWLRTSSPLEQVQQFIRGSLNYAAIRPYHFPQLKIPLPPLAEQERLVSRLDQLAARLNEARRLRDEIADEANSLSSAIVAEVFSDSRLDAEHVRLEEVSAIRSGVTLGRKNLKGELVSLPYLRVANVQDGFLDLTEIKTVSVGRAEADKWQLVRGDLLLTEGGDWDKLGRGTVWNDEIPNCIHQNHIFRVRVDRTKFVPEFIAAFLRSPSAKAYFQEASKKTTNLASINQRELRAFQIPMPTVAIQRDAVNRLKTLESQTKRMRDQQAALSTELDALMPALLNRAFAGEL